MLDYLMAGPILRRVTSDLVCVWLATDRELALKLIVFNDTLELGASDPTLLTPPAHCQLGKQLFVYLLQARPMLPDTLYPFDTLLSYRIECNGKLLDFNRIDLTYAGAKHPSFFIPRELKQLLHGSCRKPHGNARDALSFGDDQLADTYHDLENRPALMLLTGDQIYADDVADSILAMLRQKAEEMLGYQALLPWEAIPKSRFNRLKEWVLGRMGRESKPEIRADALFNPATLPTRQYIAKQQAGFTSTEAKNHLLTFGEYAAMYVYVFGNAKAWQPDFSKESGGRLKDLISFNASLPKVRRLLANIPTYMIFDDHDVTDDWNITLAWHYNVRKRVLGQHVIANALAAYWAFQGWGNAPENFDSNFIGALADYFATAPSSSMKVSDRYELTTWKTHSWGYSVPTNPPIIVLDSRTQRQEDGAYYPSQLLDRYAFDWLRVEWAMLKAKMELEGRADMPVWPIFVTTTPVIGFAQIERLQQYLLWIAGSIADFFTVRWLDQQLLNIEGKVTGYIIKQFDMEAWIANRDGFAKFLNCLLHNMRLSQCVFLSGDVHYSFTAEANFHNNGRTLRCFQLTSSSLCNIPNSKEKFEKLSNNVVNKKQGLFAHKGNVLSLYADQRWQMDGHFIAIKDSPTEERITPTCNMGLVSFNQGLPVMHSLLNGKLPEVFVLPTKN